MAHLLASDAARIAYTLHGRTVSDVNPGRLSNPELDIVVVSSQ